MAKAQPVSKFEKFLMYAFGVLVSAFLAANAVQNTSANKMRLANYKHSISADVKLDGLKQSMKEAKVERKETQKQVSVVCGTQKVYWPEHAKDC